MEPRNIEEEAVHGSDGHMIIFVDADACPVTREAAAIARKHRLPVVLVANESQNLDRFADREEVEIMKVRGGPDSADFAMVPRLSPGDIVVTNDTGLAAMALGRGARALSPRGKVFLAGTIDLELDIRHAEKRHRRAGGRTSGPPPFEPEHRAHFREPLERLITER